MATGSSRPTPRQPALSWRSGSRSKFPLFQVPFPTPRAPLCRKAFFRVAGEVFGVVPPSQAKGVCCEHLCSGGFAPGVFSSSALLFLSTGSSLPITQFDPATKMDQLLSASCVSDIHFNAGKARLQQRLLLLGREKVKLG